MTTDKYQIRWFYHHGITACAINSLSGRHIESGRAVCNKTDHFCRDTGRKISLARAMAAAKLSKEERTEIWKTYCGMKKNGRWTWTDKKLEIAPY